MCPGHGLTPISEKAHPGLGFDSEHHTYIVKNPLIYFILTAHETSLCEGSVVPVSRGKKHYLALSAECISLDMGIRGF